jgi:thiamine pyrophosphokinase
LSAYILIANGPFVTQDFILEAIQNRIIIALDGAADKLMALDIAPHVILGDFDSINKITQQYWGILHDFDTMSVTDQPYYGLHGVTIVPTKDQSETDLVKAIRYCDSQGATDISIICASFGRDDLHEANKHALETEYRTNRPMILHSEQQSLCWAEHEEIMLQGYAGDYCGFVATAPGFCDTQGLCYDGKQLRNSFCNRLLNATATITVRGKALIIMPPQLASQRRDRRIM